MFEENWVRQKLQALPALRASEGVGAVQRGRISRVVPGRLVYVEAGAEHALGAASVETYAVKLNDVLVERADNLTPYRGESFSELGLAEGTEVFIVRGLHGPEVNAVVVPTSPTRRRLRRYIHQP